MDRPSDVGPEVGILRVALTPRTDATFVFAPARSLHAALLRRLELFAPDVTRALHDAPNGSSSSHHPWAVSLLEGPVEPQASGLVAPAGKVYAFRVSGLVSPVVDALRAAFEPSHPLGAEPVVLEHVPFDVVWEESGWARLATYASLLNQATPRRRLTLGFQSPTGFRSAAGTTRPTPRLCLEGYLRKWNGFASVEMPTDAVLAFAEEHLVELRSEFRPALLRLGRYSERGVMGWAEWLADGSSPMLLRLVNALVDYSEFCGTGMKTAQGMGQTERLSDAPDGGSRLRRSGARH